MTRDPALDTRTLLPETRSGSSTLDRSSLRTSHSDSTLGYTLTPDQCARLECANTSLPPDSQAQAPDPSCLTLAVSTVLLLPREPQLFTSRNSNTVFLKISLKPFRHYSKASKSLKPTPFRPQNNISPLLPSSDSLYSTHADRTPKPDLHSPKFWWWCWFGSWATIWAGKRKEWYRFKKKWNRWERWREADNSGEEEKKRKSVSAKKKEERKRKRKKKRRRKKEKKEKK